MSFAPIWRTNRLRAELVILSSKSGFLPPAGDGAALPPMFSALNQRE